MRVWKQVGVSLAVVGAGFFLWAFNSSTGQNLLAKAGIVTTGEPAANNAASASSRPAGQGGGAGAAMPRS